MAADREMPLPMGNAYFQFKHELGERADLQEFYSLGPKSYCILFRDRESGKLEQVIKVRGFFLQSDDWTSEQINRTRIRHFVDQRLRKDMTEEVFVPHFNIRIDPHTKVPYSVLSVKRFGNDTYNKRVYFSGMDSVDFTMPFGYTRGMMEERLARLEGRRRGR